MLVTTPGMIYVLWISDDIILGSSLMISISVICRLGTGSTSDVVKKPGLIH